MVLLLLCGDDGVDAAAAVVRCQFDCISLELTDEIVRMSVFSSLPAGFINFGWFFCIVVVVVSCIIV